MMLEPKVTNSSLSPSHLRSHLLDCALLAAAALLVYGRLIGADFQASWDDNVYILNNEMVRGFSWEHLRAAFTVGKGAIGQYNPLSLLSFMLDYTFWGLAPGGYHLTNIILHVVNGLLVYRLLLRLHGDRLTALIAAAIFLLHPVQVESAAWIAERKGLLSLLFMLVSWELYMRYRELDAGNGKAAYAGSVVCFLLSLLAKTASVVLPIVLLLYDWCFAPKSRKVSFGDKVPFFIAVLVFSAIEIYSEKPEHGGSLAGYHGGSPMATFFTMLPVFCRYLRLLLWPSGLTVEHWPPVHSSFDLTVAGAAFLLAGVCFSGIILWRRDRQAGFWVLFFWVGLLPVSQIVPLFLLMYEHYLYMPIIGAAALVGMGASWLRDRSGLQRQVPIYAFLGLWLLALSIVSFNRTFVWQDSLTLFLDATAKTPDNYRVWEVLGRIYFKSGQMDASRIAHERSLALGADNTDALWALGEIHTEAGELDKGQDYLQRLLKLQPAYVKAYATLGNNYRYRGDYAKAEEMYKRALALQPEALHVTMLLGKLAIQQKRYDAARSLLSKVEAEGWNPAQSAYLLASIESLAGNRVEALTWLEKALSRGFDDYELVSSDKAFSLLWQEPRFKYLLLKYFPDMDKGR